MWVTCLQENLSKGLATVGRAVAARATLPVTQNVLIQTDEGRLTLTATNLEIAPGRPNRPGNDMESLGRDIKAP